MRRCACADAPQVLQQLGYEVEQEKELAGGLLSADIFIHVGGGAARGLPPLPAGQPARRSVCWWHLPLVALATPPTSGSTSSASRLRHAAASQPPAPAPSLTAPAAPLPTRAQLRGQAVAIEVDGPDHYTRNSPLRPLAHTLCRDLLLRTLVPAAASVPWSEWNGLASGAEERAYLSRRWAVL
jgi:hypothetical protein